MTQDDSENPYLIAITCAWEELSQLQEQERQLTLKKARLKGSIDALFPLAFPHFQPSLDLRTMSLANAIRLVVKSSNDRAITVKEIRGRLFDIGFDLSRYENPLASIHTASRRMVESEELVWVDDDGKKLQAGPEMKPITDSGPTEEQLNTLLGSGEPEQ
jgi:hypothetical protein